MCTVSPLAVLGLMNGKTGSPSGLLGESAGKIFGVFEIQGRQGLVRLLLLSLRMSS